MRFGLSLFSLLLLAFVLTACDDTKRYDEERLSDNIRDQMEDIEEDIESTREELQERLDRAEERIREELEEFEGDDTITKEELEELRTRIRESAERVREEMRDSERDFEVVMKNLGKALEKIGDALQEDSDIQPVDHRKLKDMLPREVAGMERYDTDGSSNSVLGIRTSKIEAKYEGPNSNMSIKIVDLGSISGAATVGLEFIDASVDRQYDHGFERTTEIDGYPAILKFDDRGRTKRHEAVIMVSERFVVEIKAEGRDLDNDIIEQVVDHISLRRLVRLARY